MLGTSAPWKKLLRPIDRIGSKARLAAEFVNTNPFEAEQFSSRQAIQSSYERTGEVLGEAEQLELASGLLEVAGDAQLDGLLADLISRASQAVGRFFSPPEGKAIGAILKGAAKRVLSGIGLGRDAVSMIGRDFGLELEGLSSEDREFAIARHYVDFAGEAVKNLALASISSDPRTAADAAVVEAAKTYAPGLLRSQRGAKTGTSSLRHRHHRAVTAAREQDRCLWDPATGGGTSYAHWMLDQEARALLERLVRVKPFVLTEPMVLAASLLPAAQIAIERFLAKGRHELKQRIGHFLAWLQEEGRQASPEELQRRFVLLRLRFNSVLSQLDLFNQVITQRSENELGVWLSGLDVVAADALALPGYYEPPPVICYLDRGIGAAIRRARTRLPGGGESPVAVIRVPRERMIGSGIASSLIHEVGHQGAALLGLVPSLRLALQAKERVARDPFVWRLWERWVSEIISDFWSIARVGVVSTLGLIGVLSLPRAFVFRTKLSDPHPVPWIRVKLSCAIGDSLYPHSQWRRVAELWNSYYPIGDIAQQRRELFVRLENSFPEFISVLINHSSKSLRGRSLPEAMEVEQRSPARLSSLFDAWRKTPKQLYLAPPSLVFAVLGQAKADGGLSPEDESELLAKLLSFWAMRSTLDGSAYCASLPRAKTSAAQMT